VDVGVDQAGEQDAHGHVDGFTLADACGHRQALADGENPISHDQDIGNPPVLGVEHVPLSQQCPGHGNLRARSIRERCSRILRA
jgi:hypothetical protein